MSVCKECSAQICDHVDTEQYYVKTLEHETEENAREIARLGTINAILEAKVERNRLSALVFIMVSVGMFFFGLKRGHYEAIEDAVCPSVRSASSLVCKFKRTVGIGPDVSCSLSRD